jgi:hypothetical protein
VGLGARAVCGVGRQGGSRNRPYRNRTLRIGILVGAYLPEVRRTAAAVAPVRFGYPAGYGDAPPAIAPAEEPAWGDEARPGWESEGYG